MTLTDLQIQNFDGTPRQNLTSECRGDDCTCVNLPDDSVQTEVVKGDVRLVGIISNREGDCRYEQCIPFRFCFKLSSSLNTASYRFRNGYPQY